MNGNEESTGTKKTSLNANSLHRLVSRYSILVDLLGSLLFGDQKTDMMKIKAQLNLPERKILQGRRIVRDIIAIGGTKTYQLNNLEMLFQDEE